MALSIESKVGAFFIIALVILGVITFKVENMSELFKRRVTYYADFNHASGINTGDPVAIAGVRVGEVKKLDLKNNGVRMTLVLETTAQGKIKTDSTATAAWGGLLGNRYIDITLGTPEAKPLPPGSDLPTVPAIEITGVLAKLDAAADELKKALGGGGVGDKISSIADNLKKISDDIAQGKGTIGKLVTSSETYDKINSIADDLKDVAARVRGIVDRNEGRADKIFASLEEAVPEAKDAFASIKRLSDNAENGKGILPALLNDEKMYQDFKDSLAKLKVTLDHAEQSFANISAGKGLIGRAISDEKTAEDFSQAVSSIRVIAERVEKGDNTLARLTRDDDLYKQAKGVLDDARESMRGLKEQVPLGTFGSVLLSVF